jgi:hypothetical protein
MLPSNVAVAPSPESANFPRSAIAVSVKGFVGIHSKDNQTFDIELEMEPPDQGLAVNNNVAAEINNIVLRFFNASTGAPLTPPIALSSLFLLPRFVNSIGHPQAFFDPATGRWFFTQIVNCIANPLGCFGNGIALGVAVSETSDPLGSYFIYYVRLFSDDLPACGGSDCFPDYLHGGYDANGFYISVNLGLGFAAGAATYALPKAKLEAGESFTFVRILYPDDYVVQPSVPAPGEAFETAANGTEYLLEARNIVDRSRNVRVWAISNTNNIVSKPSSLRAFAVDVPGEAYGLVVPATEPNVLGPFCKSQGAKFAPLLDGVFNAFQSTIQKASGRLYGALPFGSVDGTGLLRDSIAWFAVKPSVDSTGHPSASIVKRAMSCRRMAIACSTPPSVSINPARAPWALASPTKARTCPAVFQARPLSNSPARLPWGASSSVARALPLRTALLVLFGSSRRGRAVGRLWRRNRRCRHRILLCGQREYFWRTCPCNQLGDIHHPDKDLAAARGRAAMS